MSYEIDPDGRGTGLAIGVFGVLAIVAAFGGLRGAPGALVLFGICVAAIAVLSRRLARGGLVLDERGITDDRAGETVPWPEVADIRIAERGGKSFLAVQRVDGVLVDIPISSLEAAPEIVLERAGKVRRAYAKPAY